MKPWSLQLVFFLIFCAFTVNLFSQQFPRNDAQKTIANGIQLLQSDTFRALYAFRNSVDLALASGDRKTAAEAYLRCAATEKLIDSNTAAINHYEQSALLYETAGMHAEAAEVYTELGKLQYDLARFQQAIASFNKSDEIALAREFEVAHAHNLVGSGMVLIKLSDLVNAQQNFVEALEIFEVHKDTAGIADAWNGIGIVHWKEGKNTEAMNAYEKSLELRSAISDSLGIAASHSNMGIICRLQEKYEESLNHYMIALGIRQRNRDRLGEAQVLFNIGSLLTDMNRNEEGLEYYNRSYAIKKSIGDVFGLLPYYLNTGELYGTLRQNAKQEQSLVTGLALADSLNAIDYIKSFNRDLAGYYASIGDYKNAFIHHQRYSEIKDTLSSREKNAELARLQAEYDLKDKQRSIDKLESDQRELIEQQERATLFRIGLIIIIVLVLLFTTFVVNRTLVLRRTNEALSASKKLVEKRDQEKEVLLREVHHRVKNNLQLTSSLLNLQAREMKDSDAAQALKEARDRLKAISLVHQELFSGKELNTINLSTYIPDLCNAVMSSNNTGEQIHVEYKLDPVSVSLDNSVTLGLMLNEIIINSIKHAFAGIADPVIRIHCTKQPGGLRISVTDNGKGVPEEVLTRGRSGFGMKLLQSLAKKLGTEPEIKVDPGTRVSIFVPEDAR